MTADRKFQKDRFYGVFIYLLLLRKFFLVFFHFHQPQIRQIPQAPQLESPSKTLFSANKKSLDKNVLQLLGKFTLVSIIQ